ncbi:hypothetical protein DL98DRAFT_431944, partial [Cadophora sp. DSE1049]
GIIVAERVHHVELANSSLDRFHSTPRSSNSTEEDIFCRNLRKIGGKWWSSWWDCQEATKSKMRMMWPDEREVLFLGWPEAGGVWLLRYENLKQVHGDCNDSIYIRDIGTIYSALTMEERCEGIKLSGGVFFESPKESEVVRPLLEGLGNHERKDPELEDGGWWDHGYEL